jgi:hypothetical protein
MREINHSDVQDMCLKLSTKDSMIFDLQRKHADEKKESVASEKVSLIQEKHAMEMEMKKLRYWLQ